MKKIKLRKRRRFKYRILLYAFLVFLGYELTFNIILNIKLAKTNEDFIKALLIDSNYHLLYEKKANDVFHKIFSYFFDINEPVKILENTFHLKASATEYVKNPKEKIEVVSNIKKEPLIFLYNTHQAEEYQGKTLEPYNIKPGVMMASYIMQDKLEKIGINSIVLEDNIVDYMNLNNMKHALSYKASRHFIEDTIKNNSSLKLILDIHRDSISKDKATVNISGKNCAKIMFVVGSEYDTYKENLKLTNELETRIKNKYPSLTRGVLIKGGKGSNGIYNQDLNSKMTLIEIGADTNTIDEVLNTINLLVPIIGEYINE